MWKEAGKGYLKVLSQYLPSGPEEKHENPSHDNKSDEFQLF
jgi:hypothetical protein